MIKLVARSTFSSVTQIRNIFYCQELSSPSTIPSDTAVQTFMSALWPTALKGLIGLEWSMYAVDVEEGIGGNFVLQKQVPITGVAGTAAINQMLPPQVAGVVIAHTGVKRVVPKKFIAGLIRGQDTNGLIGSSQASALATFAATWLAGFDDGTNHFTSGTQLTDGTFAAITSVLVDGLLGTSRRRKAGVGI